MSDPTLLDLLTTHGLTLGRRHHHRREVLHPDGTIATTGNALDVWHWLHRTGRHTLRPETLATIAAGWCGCGCREVAL